MEKRGIADILAENLRLQEEEEAGKRSMKPSEELYRYEPPAPEDKGPIITSSDSVPWLRKGISTGRDLQKEVGLKPNLEGLKPLNAAMEGISKLDAEQKAQVAEIGEKMQKESETLPEGESIDMKKILKEVGIKGADDAPPAWLKGILDASVAALPLIIGQIAAPGSVGMYAGGTGALAAAEYLEKRRKEDAEKTKDYESLILKSELERKLTEAKAPVELQKARVKGYLDRANLIQAEILKTPQRKTELLKEMSKLITVAEKDLSEKDMKVLLAGIGIAKPEEFKPEKPTQPTEGLGPAEKAASSRAGLMVANRSKAISEIDSTINIFDNPKISEDQKIAKGNEILKTLNDSSAQDALSGAEAERLMPFLQFHVLNLTGPGPKFGRDLNEFAKQLRITKAKLQKSNVDALSMIEEIKRTKKIPTEIPAQSQVQQGGAAPVLKFDASHYEKMTDAEKIKYGKSDFATQQQILREVEKRMKGAK